jgi:hypothetical protein
VCYSNLVCVGETIKGGEERIFVIHNLHVKMSKMFRRYCSRLRVQPTSCRFLEDGVLVDGEDTYYNLASGVGAEEGIVTIYLDCMMEQTGGCFFHRW